MDFWKRAEALLAAHEMIIDRPKGSRHPKFPELIYPLDYGYLKGTSGSDGNEADVWKGSLSGRRLTALICTVDVMKNDIEVKLLVDCTPDEAEIAARFYSHNNFMSGLLIPRK